MGAVSVKCRPEAGRFCAAGPPAGQWCDAARPTQASRCLRLCRPHTLPPGPWSPGCQAAPHPPDAPVGLLVVVQGVTGLLQLAWLAVGVADGSHSGSGRSQAHTSRLGAICSGSGKSIPGIALR